MTLPHAVTAILAAMLLAGCQPESDAPTPDLSFSTGSDRITASQTMRNDLRCKIAYTLHNSTNNGLFDVAIAWQSLSFDGDAPPVSRIKPEGTVTGAFDVVLAPPATPERCAEIAEDLEISITDCRSFGGTCPTGSLPRR